MPLLHRTNLKALVVRGTQRELAAKLKLEVAVRLKEQDAERERASKRAEEERARHREAVEEVSRTRVLRCRTALYLFCFRVLHLIISSQKLTGRTLALDACHGRGERSTVFFSFPAQMVAFSEELCSRHVLR